MNLTTNQKNKTRKTESDRQTILYDLDSVQMRKPIFGEVQLTS